LVWLGERYSQGRQTKSNPMKPNNVTLHTKYY